MLIHGINDNILIPKLSYFGAYQDGLKMRDIQRDHFWGGVGNKPKKTDKTVVHISPSTLRFLNI